MNYTPGEDPEEADPSSNQSFHWTGGRHCRNHCRCRRGARCCIQGGAAGVTVLQEHDCIRNASMHSDSNPVNMIWRNLGNDMNLAEGGSCLLLCASTRSCS